MAPADSLARLRKALIDRAERKEAPVTKLCREAGISRSRFSPASPRTGAGEGIGAGALAVGRELHGVGEDGVHERLGQASVGSLRRSRFGRRPASS